MTTDSPTVQDVATGATALPALGLDAWLAGPGADSLEAMWPYLAPSVAQVHDAAALVEHCGSLDTSWFEPLFGRDWPGHAFAHRPHFFGFRADEPHYTKMLAAFMTPAHVGASVAWERARVFLGVLADAGALPQTLRPAEGQQVTVEAEVPVDGGRIDLLFCWQNGNGTNVVAVEAKFGAPVGDGQLELYQAALPEEALILLASRRQKTLPDEWKQVLWRGILPRWENAIATAGDDDQDFARYRRALWTVALNGGKHD